MDGASVCMGTRGEGRGRVMATFDPSFSCWSCEAMLTWKTIISNAENVANSNSSLTESMVEERRLMV